MKKKRLLIFALAFALTSTTALVGCNAWKGLWEGNDSSVLETGETIAAVESSTDTMVAIKVEKAEEDKMLIEVMESLQKEGALTFKAANGMISEINGKANALDWSASWMLYTSDAEMANEAWGTYEYEGETLGSAIVGAESLPIADGVVYVWYYQSF